VSSIKTNEFDFFMQEPAAPELVDFALRGMHRYWGGVHPHDALEVAVEHRVDPSVMPIFCFQALVRAREIEREKAYLPYEALPKGWIDNVEI
jgi:hypothetical protein